ncbi:MAG: hypothetical protein ACFWT4_20065 [Citrobacter braakii]|jgi:hypothetical protein
MSATDKAGHTFLASLGKTVCVRGALKQQSGCSASHN